MTLWIGRCGIDVALDDPDTFDFTGPDGFTITGWLRGYDATDATAKKQVKALRQQLLGHVGDVIPVWHDEDTTTGCYARLKSVAVKASGKDISLVLNQFAFTATFSECFGQMPLIEMHSFGMSRDTATGTPQGIVGQPDSSDAQYFSGNTGLGSEDRNGLSPPAYSADVVHTFITTDTQLDDSYNSFVCPPRNFYDMGSFLFIDGYVVAGRGNQVDQLSNLSDWLITNGLIKVEPGATGMFKLTCLSAPSSPTWATASMEFTPQFYAGGAWADIGQGTPQVPDAIDIAVNEAHEVTVRFVCTILQPAKIRALVTVSVRRGCRHAELSVECGLALPFGLVAESGTWTNGSTQVIWENADNADGNRYAIFSKETRDAANKRMGTSGTSKTYFQAGIAGIIDGNSASGNETEVNVRDQYNKALNETVRFVRP